MKKTLTNVFVECFILCFIILLFFYSKDCMELASKGLNIWFLNMIPSLFPFMILSGFMIRSGLSYKFGKILQPVLGTVFQLPHQMLYVIFMGFLCGFPMGAKVIADMLEDKLITNKEGEFLLTFCNNIGPLYMLGYVIPLFHIQKPFKILLLMYGVPFGYGLFLRYFSKYKEINTKSGLIKSEIKSVNYLSELYNSLNSAIEQITLLGGCMIFFNCLQIFPLSLEKYILNFVPTTAFTIYLQGILCSILEIGGGLSYFASHNNSSQFISLSDFLPISVCLLTFGGMSCFFQTYLILKKTNLSILNYIKHKLLQVFFIVILCYIF